MLTGRDLIGKLRNLLWIILLKQLHSDLAFVLCTYENIKFYQRENTWKLFQFAVSDNQAAGGKCFLKIIEFSHNFHFTLPRIM